MNILFAVKEIETESLGIMYLSSILKKAGHKVETVEARYDRVKNKLKSSNFSVLAYTVSSPSARYYLNLNRRIKKEFKIFSVFGGCHFTLFPEAIQEPGVDGVCIGEGEYPLLDLANNLDSGKPITNIENWWIKIGGHIFRNASRPLIDDLNKLPFPDRQLFASRYPSAYITTSRGCPYSCSYCTEKGRFRQRSIDNVIEELQEIRAKKRINFIYFLDSTFNFSFTWMEEFCNVYKKEIGLPFFCFVRADLITPEGVLCLKNAGCQQVFMGNETSNAYLQNKILNKNISEEKVISAARIIKKAGIRLTIANIIGIPLGSLEDDLATLKMNIRCRPDYAKANIFHLYRGSELYDFVRGDPRFKLPDIQTKDYYLFVDALDAGTARKIRRLEDLFGLLVEFPFFLPAVKIILRLPLGRLYSYLYFLWRGFCHYFRLCDSCTGWAGFKIGLKRYARMLREV